MCCIYVWMWLILCRYRHKHWLERQRWGKLSPALKVTHLHLGNGSPGITCSLFGLSLTTTLIWGRKYMFMALFGRYLYFGCKTAQKPNHFTRKDRVNCLRLEKGKSKKREKEKKARIFFAFRKCVKFWVLVLLSILLCMLLNSLNKML